MTQPIICRTCGDDKGPFVTLKGKPKNLCVICNRTKASQWRANNKERYKGNLRRAHLKRQFGINDEQYATMLAKQSGVCAICNTPPTDKRHLAVDHCHESGKLRSLLCHSCNNHLGIYERNQQRFAAYLEKHK